MSTGITVPGQDTILPTKSSPITIGNTLKISHYQECQSLIFTDEQCDCGVR